MIDRIITYSQRRKRNKINKQLIKKGILRVGNNSDIDNLEISISAKLEQNFPNIIIGDDCTIHCKIIIYNTDAKVIIGNRVYIGPQTLLFCNCGITIEDDILFSWGITVIDTNSHPVNFEDRKNDVVDSKKGKKDWSKVKNAPVLIRSKAWIGFNSIITKGVTIGEAAIVSCGSVVVKNVDEYSIVGGNPASKIKTNENFKDAD
jgi:galactoside O-acetyltransferase